MLPNGTELIPRAYLQYSLDVVWLHSLSSTYWTQAEQQAVASLPSFCENKAGRGYSTKYRAKEGRILRI